MSFGTFCFVFLLASTFSEVSCAPQTPSQATDEISNDPGSSAGAEHGVLLNTPFDTASVPGTNSQDNGLGVTPSTDSTVVGIGLTGGGAGGATAKSSVQ